MMALIPLVVGVKFLADIRFATPSKLSFEVVGQMTLRGHMS